MSERWAHPHKALDDFFAQKNGFPGADGIYSFPFRGGYLFYFGDTIKRRGNDFVLSHNSFLRLDSSFKHPVYLCGENETIPTNRNDGSFYWFQDGALEGNALYVFALRVKTDSKSGFLLLGTDLLRIDASSYPNIRFSKISSINDPTLLYGSALIKKAGFYYVFCYTNSSPKQTIVARCESLEHPSFEYLREDGIYRKDRASLRIIFTLLGAENKIYFFNGRFYMAYSPGGISKEIRLTSFSSIGDLIPKGELIYECPEFCGEDIAYNAKIQPALSKGNKIVITYNVNSLKEERVINSDIYRPHFLEVTL